MPTVTPFLASFNAPRTRGAKRRANATRVQIAILMRRGRLIRGDKQLPSMYANTAGA